MGPIVALFLVATTLSACFGWYTQLSTSDGSWLSSVTCSGALCIAVGTGASGNAMVERSTDAGSSWTNDTNGVAGLGLDSVSCAGALHCVAVGGEIRGGVLSAANTLLVSTDSGQDWSASSIPSLNAYLNSVSCADTEDCWATTAMGTGGSSTILATNDGGAGWANLHWNPPPLPEDATALVASQLDAIDCPTTDDCLAVGQATYATTLSPPIETQGVVSTTDNGGSTWTSQLIGGTDISSITCPISSECMAVVQNAGSKATQSVIGLSSPDGGATWSVSPLAAGTQIAEGHAPDINAIACFDTLHCMAVGKVFDSDEYETPVTASTDGGTAWSNQTVNPDDADLQSVACTTLSNCWAVGSTTQGSVIVRTINAGVATPNVTGVSPGHGPTGGGTVVTITGSGFNNVTQSVSFGAATTTDFTVDSDTQITVVLPPAAEIVQETAAVVDVRVTTALGTSPLNPADQFTYTG
jgi:hypothetical protein